MKQKYKGINEKKKCIINIQDWNIRLTCKNKKRKKQKYIKYVT